MPLLIVMLGIGLLLVLILGFKLNSFVAFIIVSLAVALGEGMALNAAVEAARAGEAGRGFAVVADEVQRLAERAANATKQIEVLVRTIQTDTNEAVVSMERTTTDVVGGALLAENAGAALGEIEDVSNQIAQLVQNISASARQQATSSQSISRNMQVLREISQQTADNTSATSTPCCLWASSDGSRFALTAILFPLMTTASSVASTAASTSSRPTSWARCGSRRSRKRAGATAPTSNTSLRTRSRRRAG